MEDAAAGWELVFSILFCKQTGSYKILNGQMSSCLSRKEKYNVVYHRIPVGANSVLLGLRFARQAGCIAVEEQTSQTSFAIHSVGVGR